MISDEAFQTAVRSIYRSCYSDSGDNSLNRLFNNQRYEVYTLGRVALYFALKALKLKPGDSILLPSLICKEVLHPLEELELKLVFFDVSPSLQPVLSEDQLPTCQAILCVNYFGFPQDIDFFKRYCQRTKAVLIEDNAQGFLSRDSSNTLLGTRGHCGIVSFHKTFHIGDGAALVSADPSFTFPKLPTHDSPHESPTHRLKTYLRDQQFLFASVIQKTLQLKRNLSVARKKSSENEGKPRSADIFGKKVGPQSIKKLIQYDWDYEVKRRRTLFLKIGEILNNVEPVMKTLDAGTVPYIYPFYLEDKDVKRVTRLLSKHALQFFSWPDLPNEVCNTAPDYYKKLYGVRFLW